jgi:carboxyl-terminal processing protease
VLNRRRLLRWTGLITGLVAVVAISFLGGVWLDQTYPELVPPLGMTQQAQLDRASVDAALRDIEAHYYDSKVDYGQLSQGSIQGMANGLHDPYTQYFTPEQYQQELDLYAGRHNGVIGVYISFSGQRPVISGVLPGSPAQKASLLNGDVIEAIDGKDTTGLASDRVSQLIRGRPGTAVTLSIMRQGQHLSVQVDRANFVSPTVQSARLSGDVLYLRIYEFGTNTEAEFNDRLKAGLPGTRGVILDLRDNGGGYVSAASAVVSRFVASGEVFETRGRDGTQQTQVAGSHPAANIPLVVLVNGNSASAAEIVAGSLQAHHRAQLVGTKTFGKGSVQVDYPLPNGGDLHLTVQHWYLPNGHTIDHAGLEPDVAVSLPKPTDMFDVVEASRGHAYDTQLNQALRSLG